MRVAMTSALEAILADLPDLAIAVSGGVGQHQAALSSPLPSSAGEVPPPGGGGVVSDKSVIEHAS